MESTKELIDDLYDSSTNEYFNSRPIDVHWVSEHPKVQKVTNNIFYEVLTLLDYQKQRKEYLREIRKHVQLVVLDAYLAYLADPAMYVAYPRGKNSYHKKSRYTKLYISHRHLIKNTVDVLDDLEYIEGKNGFIDRESGKGFHARMRATPKLINMIQNNKINRYMIKRNELEEIIILKNKDEEKIDYEDTDETNRMRKNLDEINEWLSKTFIDIYIPDKEFLQLQKKLALSGEDGKEPINFLAKKLHRVFNNESFHQGGRFYGGWWQHIPREYRKFIQIGGGREGLWPKYSVEYDYNAQHIRILYADVGIDYGKRDPFDLGNGDQKIRSLVKQAYYTIVNCKSEAQAIEAVDYQLMGGVKGKKKRIDKSKKVDLPAGINGAEDIVRLLRENHKPIEEYLYSGQGLFLQRRDSDIAEKVMLRMKKMGARALPVHDSFLVSKSFDIYVPEVMRKAFKEEIGVTCPVSQKETNLQYRARTRKGPVKELWFAPTFKEFEEEEREYSLFNARCRQFQELHS